MFGPPRCNKAAQVKQQKRSSAAEVKNKNNQTVKNAAGSKKTQQQQEQQQQQQEQQQQRRPQQQQQQQEQQQQRRPQQQQQQQEQQQQRRPQQQQQRKQGRSAKLVPPRTGEEKLAFQQLKSSISNGLAKKSGELKDSSDAGDYLSQLVKKPQMEGQHSASDPSRVSIFSAPCSNPSAHPGCCSQTAPVAPFFTQRGWFKGPSDPSGTVVNLSDRPSLCMSVQGNELAVGSSDHAVYTVDVQTCKLSRIMYGKSYGHTEWVTCIDHLPDGRIISGGMDNKLCLWEKRGVRSRDLKGHIASVSAVKAGLFNHAAIAVSSSYDKSLILWDVGGSSGKELGKLLGHKEAVLDFVASENGRLVSGSRDGSVILWDVNSRLPVLQCKNAHKGQVSALELLEAENAAQIFLTGGQDGVLQVWDFRCSTPVHSVTLHRSTKGVGALSCISVTKAPDCACPLVTTAGADRLLRVLDVRASFKILHTLEEHRDFIYSLYTNGALAWSGAGDGSLLVHNLVDGKCLYGLGATSNGAVRGISLAGEGEQNKLVITGDDGNLMIYSL